MAASLGGLRAGPGGLSLLFLLLLPLPLLSWGEAAGPRLLPQRPSLPSSPPSPPGGRDGAFWDPLPSHLSSSCRLGFLTLTSHSVDGSHSSLESEMGRGVILDSAVSPSPPLLSTSGLTPRLPSDSAFLAWFLQRLPWGLAALSLSPSYRSLCCLHDEPGPCPIFTASLPPDSAPRHHSCHHRLCPLSQSVQAGTTAFPL